MERQTILQSPQTVIREMPKAVSKKMWPLILVSLVIVILGIGTGWLLAGNSFTTKTSGTPNQGVKVTANEAGVVDESNFDGATAEGVLEEEGLNGEGTHHLVRDGGTSRYVYLTSSVIDLQSFVGKKVMIWGETLSSKKAGWLMDVVKVKVID